MKKYIIPFALIAMAFSISCARMEESSPEISRVTFNASVESTSTKTMLTNEGSKILWQPKDAISIFHDGTPNERFISTNTEPAAEASFEGNLGLSTQQGADFWAIYPWSNTNDMKDDLLEIEIPHNQTVSAANFDPKAFVTVAHSKSFDLQFYNVCGGIKFSVSNENIKRIIFKGNNNETIAGKVSIGWDTYDHPVVNKVLNGAKEIVVEQADSAPFEVGVWYYIAALPVKLEKGFTLTFQRADESINYSVDKTVEIKRSIWGRLEDADEDVPFGLLSFDKECVEFADWSAGSHTLSFSTTRPWSIQDKSEWLAVSSSSGGASYPEKTVLNIQVLENTGYSRWGIIDFVSGDQEKTILVFQPGKLGNTTMLLYFAGFNSLSAYLKADEEELLKGYLPSKDERDNVLLVFSKYKADSNNYNTQTAPVLTRYYRDEDGNPKSDVVKTWEMGTDASSAATIQEVTTLVKDTYSTDHYGMVYSSHATGWLPAGYYSNPSSFENMAGAPTFSNKAPYLEEFNPMTKSVGSDVYMEGGESVSHEMGIHEMADAIAMHLDYILFDACFMGGIEAAYAFKEKADFFVGMPAEILAEGLNYQTITTHIFLHSCDVKGVCQEFFDYYDRQSGTYRSAAISMIDCRNLNAFAKWCAEWIPANRSHIYAVDPNSVQGFFRMGRHYFYDMKDILVKAGLGSLESEFQNLLDQVVVYKAATPYFLTYSIVNYCGLSMYLPANGSKYLDEYYMEHIRWNDEVQLVADNSQILLLKIADTKATGDFMENPIVDGMEVSVNGGFYTISPINECGGQLGVRVPQAAKYVISLPANVASAEDEGRVKVTIEKEGESATSGYYYASCENEVSPISVTVSPCVAMIRLTLDDSLYDWSYLELTANAQDEYFAGSASYYLGYTPSTVFSGDKSRTIRINRTGTSQTVYIPAFPQTLSEGFSLAVYNASGKLLAEKSRTKSTTIEVGRIYSMGTISAPEPETTPSWLELPAYEEDDNHIALIHDMQGGQYISSSTSGVRNWTGFWDRNEHLCHWVAYPLNNGLRGSGGRSDTWGLDPLLPANEQPNLTNSSYGGGWTRGHQIPSADRLSHAANVSTFYGTNMTPQEYNFNGGIWAVLEGQVRNYASQADTLYVVTGCMVQNSTTYTGSNSGFQVKVPTHYYKALLFRKSNNFKAIGYLMPHDAGIANQNCDNYKMTIDELEAQTGIDFFPNLKKLIGESAAEAIEGTIDNW